MNKIYRLKFDRRRNQLVAVSELTTGAGKQKSTGRSASRAGSGGASVLSLRPLLAALTLVTLPGLALANPDLPVGGQIVAGQGGISTSGNQMTIQQQTQKLVTQWQSFDVGAQNTVRFIQPDSNSVALNRVMGASGSQILGSLQANGKVIILNPNGVLFGKDAQVNVAGLLASTKNLSTADFMADRYDLSGGSADAQVVNQGNLVAAPGGYIVLAGGQVKNSGTITTPAGKTVLAAADKVSLQLDNSGLVSVSVSGGVVNALVENTGLIAATNGQVYLTARGRDMLLNTVVNNSGTVEATGLESRGGEIVLDGGDSGVVSQSGRLLADSAAGQGGKVTLEGRNIHLAAAGKTSATGKTGGGQVYVGGGWQGKDGKIRNASKVVMDKAATIDVSATQSGNGGTAVLWSEDYTNFQGGIAARGGAGSGNGGQVETSSRGNLQAFGDVDASASAGLGGNWLLDPLDVAIVKGDVGTDTVVMQGDTSGQVFSPSASGAQVSATKITEQLNAGTSVTVDTHANGDQPGTITFKGDAQVKKTAGGAATLTLKADKDIAFENRQDWVDPDSVAEFAIQATAGALNLSLLTGNGGQDGNVTIGRYVHFALNGGDFHVGPANADSGKTSLAFTNNGSITAGNITLDTLGGISGNYYGLTAAGDLTVKGPMALTAGFGIVSPIKAGGLLSITADSGDIQFAAVDVTDGPSVGGTIAISGKKGVVIQANNGQLVMNVKEGGKKPNVIQVASTDGDVTLAGKRKGASGKGDGLQLTRASVSSDSGVMTLTGDGVTLSGNTLSATRLEVTGLVAKEGEALAGNTLKGGLVDSNNVVLGTGALPEPVKDTVVDKEPEANPATNPDASSVTDPDTATQSQPGSDTSVNENPDASTEKKPDSSVTDPATPSESQPGSDTSVNENPDASTEKKPDTPSVTNPDTSSEETKPKPEEKPEPKPEEKPEPNPEVKPEPKPEEKPELKPEEKPEPNPEVKPEPNPEEKPEPNPEEKPELKPEEKPELKPEEKPEPNPEVKPEPNPEEKPEPNPEVKPEPNPEVKPEPNPEGKPELKPEEKPELKPEEKPEPNPEVKPEPKPEEKPEPKPEEKPAPKPEVKPEPQPEVKPEPMPGPENQIGELPGPYPQLTAGEVAVVKSAVVTTKSQSSANAQTTTQTQAPQSGFHVSGEPAVPASHYQMATQEVSVNVCAGEECGSVKLDASKPSE